MSENGKMKTCQVKVISQHCTGLGGANVDRMIFRNSCDQDPLIDNRKVNYYENKNRRAERMVRKT